jgi:hypothetical protein
LWLSDSLRRLFRTGFVRVMLLAGALACCSDLAFAVLGQAASAPAPAGSTATPVIGASRLAAASTPRSGLYTVQEVLLETGTNVQEYANAAGIVFAVAWHGPVLPDLSVFLGDYFSTFKAEMEQARAQGKRGSQASVARANLVLHSSGRMRNFSGYAYATDLIPAGVNVKDVLQ